MKTAAPRRVRRVGRPLLTALALCSLTSAPVHARPAEEQTDSVFHRSFAALRVHLWPLLGEAIEPEHADAGSPGDTVQQTTTGLARARPGEPPIFFDGRTRYSWTADRGRVEWTADTRLLPQAPLASGAPNPDPPNGVWDTLAECESSGQWDLNNGNGFRGGLQFTLSTWHAYGGTGVPERASRAEQITVAERVLASQGWGAWPSCSRKLGYRDGGW